MPFCRTSASHTLDFDLKGILAIRVIDASDADIDNLQQLISLRRSSMPFPPDLVIRFVENFSDSGSLRLLGVNDVAYNDEIFLLRNRRTGTCETAISFAAFGDVDQATVVYCLHGSIGNQLLISILNFIALQKGLLPVHAAAFVYQGTGVLVPGWVKGGKTGVLLGFMSLGAHYIGDDWVYLDAGGQMHGLPSRLEIKDAYLEALPEYGSKLPLRIRRRRRLIKILRWLERRFPDELGMGEDIGRLRARAKTIIESRLVAHLHPDQLFDDRNRRNMAKLDKVFFVVSHEANDIRIEHILRSYLIERIVTTLEYELNELRSYYLRYRFAFPECRNRRIETVSTRARELAKKAFAGKDLYQISHPYPLPVSNVALAMRPYFDRPQSIPVEMK